ncbi:hypothetical protein [Streptomyces sp. cg35]|uniref:hypothetical protein n=1 Tax=Streptomyces sp. cg35 TaxID=3421650 RepID=UPI003D1865F7
MRADDLHLRQYNEAQDRLNAIDHDTLNDAWTQMTLAMTCETDPKKRRTYQIAVRALAAATMSERHRLALVAEISAETAALDATRTELDDDTEAELIERLRAAHPPVVREMRYAD